MQVLNGVDAGERKARVLVVQKVAAAHENGTDVSERADIQLASRHRGEHARRARSRARRDERARGGESAPKHASARHRVSVQDDDLAVLCFAARGLAVLQGARSFANASIQVVLAAYPHLGIAFANLVGIQ